MDFLIGRQAILDRNGKTFGYELLYRESLSSSTSASNIDGNTATSRVIINAFINLGMDKIAKQGKIFINFTKDLILDRVYEALPKDKIIIEVLEDVLAENEILESLKNAKKLGYTIALDDFVFLEHQKHLVELADIIKIDFLELSKKEIEDQIKLYTPYNLKLLAEKVETREDFEFALKLGFSYFQGFFFQKPTIQTKKDISPYQATIIKALKTINDPKSTLEDLISFISGDLYMHTKLLSLVNSPFFGLKSKVNSIKKAVSMLGEKKTKEWLNLLYVSKLAENKPQELIILSTVRAKFASLLAKYFNTDEEVSYILGLFSLIDSILDAPMEEVLKEFNYIDKKIKEALLGKENEYKKLLDFIKAYENGDFEAAQKIAKQTKLKNENINNYYFEAIEFSENIYIT
ncbi:EAL and HDOD domain-containing protein [Hippea maritima]|uniref:Diguanylate phosphodiesterase metal dependent hydrolase domain protein n=1 Tax=Hippea maritima (strain ATCC 700847 / DSM 10411 / MH2) TaxID=760142 RepID=F2LUW0_HIPMA|nr:HDOD domain-containing protein [Hippea maritima]AEA33565.1 diguanylate phosphodiesterase metal dependent hydrolase domain protein [Hippea maritima DSM 10411]